MDLIAVGQCIKRNREKKGLTIAELARITGLETNILEECEVGIRKPNLKELRSIYLNRVLLHRPTGYGRWAIGVGEM